MQFYFFLNPCPAADATLFLFCLHMPVQPACNGRGTGSVFPVSAELTPHVCRVNSALLP